jgi:hypothetical protein
MPVAVSLAPPDLFVVRATGDVPFHECQRAIDDVLAYSSDGGGRKILVDARGVASVPTTDELRVIARDMKLLVARGYGPIAFVTDRAFVYGVGRMFAVFAETFGMKMQAFLSVDDASHWLDAA